MDGCFSDIGRDVLFQISLYRPWVAVYCEKLKQKGKKDLVSDTRIGIVPSFSRRCSLVNPEGPQVLVDKYVPVRIGIRDFSFAWNSTIDSII